MRSLVAQCRINCLSNPPRRSTLIPFTSSPTLFSLHAQASSRPISRTSTLFKPAQQPNPPSTSSASAHEPKYHFSMPHIVDDKSPHVIPFIQQRYTQHRKHSTAPFFIGLNGVQGIGKSTLVESLAATLRSPPHELNILTFSIDDFYLPFADLQALAAANPTNPLLQQRGQPSTHDIPLALRTFRALKARDADVRIPSYDKSAKRGRGDRRPEAEWTVVNKSSDQDRGTVDVVIFEGWCVGFRAVGKSELERKWRAAREALVAESSSSSSGPGTQDNTATVEASEPLKDEELSGRLGALALPSIAHVNDALAQQGYEELFTQYLDAFVYLDAADPFFVYTWREEQERALREEKGADSAMTSDEVKRFVDGYFPAYEVYVDKVREGMFSGLESGNGEEGKEGAQMRLVIGEARDVLRAEVV